MSFSSFSTAAAAELFGLGGSAIDLEHGYMDLLGETEKRFAKMLAVSRGRTDLLAIWLRAGGWDAHIRELAEFGLFWGLTRDIRVGLDVLYLLRALAPNDVSLRCWRSLLHAALGEAAPARVLLAEHRLLAGQPVSATWGFGESRPSRRHDPEGGGPEVALCPGDVTDIHLY